MGLLKNNNLHFSEGRRPFHSQNRSAQQQQCLITQLHFEPAPNKGACKSSALPSLCVASLPVNNSSKQAGGCKGVNDYETEPLIL
jgi:hypothetical protein